MKSACLTRKIFFLNSLIVLTILFAAAGCATLSENECLNADWYIIGYEDGSRGIPLAQIGKHRKACAKHDVSPDMNRYRTGHIEGLAHHCTPRSGYRFGIHGNAYNGVCRGLQEPAFLDAYEQGKEIFRLQQSIRYKQKRIDELYDELDTIQADMDEQETELVQDGIGKKRRIQLLGSIRSAESRQLDLRSEIILIEDDVNELMITRDNAIANSPYHE
ncbi:MAG: DUF2799 domain-containing protein [Desulfobacteraceae bacterium]|nr:DUF2799 domain-containing protein [Desulfobacteraceae bacterium]